MGDASALSEGEAYELFAMPVWLEAALLLMEIMAGTQPKSAGGAAAASAQAGVAAVRAAGDYIADALTALNRCVALVAFALDNSTLHGALIFPVLRLPLFTAPSGPLLSSAHRFALQGAAISNCIMS